MVFIGSQDNKLYCLNATNGLEIWDYATGDWISSSPAVADNKVYVGSFDGFLYCFDTYNGTTLWEHPIGDMIWTSSPTIAEKKSIWGIGP